MELIVSFFKTLPTWLLTAVQVIAVFLASVLCVSLIAGFWIGLTILRKRQDYIAEISFLPFKITFYQKQNVTEIK